MITKQEILDDRRLANFCDKKKGSIDNIFLCGVEWTRETIKAKVNELLDIVAKRIDKVKTNEPTEGLSQSQIATIKLKEQLDRAYLNGQYLAFKGLLDIFEDDEAMDA